MQSQAGQIHVARAGSHVEVFLDMQRTRSLASGRADFLRIQPLDLRAHFVESKFTGNVALEDRHSGLGRFKTFEPHGSDRPVNARAPFRSFQVGNGHSSIVSVAALEPQL